MDTIATRRVTISGSKLAQAGSAYSSQFLGLTVVHTTWDGEQMVGTLDRFQHGYPVAVFADGRWARMDLDLAVVR